MEEEYLNSVKEICLKTCQDMGLTLVSFKQKHDDEIGRVIEVLIDKNFDITIDQIEEYTNRVNPLIDSLGEPNFQYTLDIASGGSEREIPFTSLNNFIDCFLTIIIKSSGERKDVYVDKMIDTNTYQFHYFVKGKKTKLILKDSEIESIHMGYKA